MNALLSTQTAIREAVAKASLPAYVNRVELSFNTDSHGWDAVWVYVILEDKAAEGPKFFERAESVRELLEAAIADTGVDVFPYVYFRTVSEQDELVTEVDD